MNTFGRVCTEDLTSKKKRDVFREITLIKEKWSIKVKGRTCADGRSQRSYITKEKAAAPMVSMEALLAQLMVGAFEERAMAIFYFPGAYLNANMPEDSFVLLKL